MAQRLGNVAVGTLLNLNENGSPVQYIVVHQGLPSSIYDSSCNGTWMLRNDCVNKQYWVDLNVSPSPGNSYKISGIQSWLSSTMFGYFSSDIQDVIKNVKIPYVNGNGNKGTVAAGANGLACKIFLLSGYEVGWTTQFIYSFPVDGSVLSYFSGTDYTDSKRIALYDESATGWWLRSPEMAGPNNAFAVGTKGSPLTANIGSRRL